MSIEAYLEKQQEEARTRYQHELNEVLEAHFRGVERGLEIALRALRYEVGIFAAGSDEFYSHGEEE